LNFLKISKKTCFIQIADLFTEVHFVVLLNVELDERKKIDITDGQLLFIVGFKQMTLWISLSDVS